MVEQSLNNNGRNAEDEKRNSTPTKYLFIAY